MGVKVIGFANNLNYSLNKKRMEMMKKEKSPTIRKVKLFMVLPVIALLMFAFATKEYVKVEDNKLPFVEQTFDDQDMISVKGVIKTESGIPLEGANIILKNTTSGTITNDKGKFEIDIPHGATFVVSYIGYETKTVTIATSKKRPLRVSVKMEKGVLNINLPEITGEEILEVPHPPPSTNSNDGEVYTIVEEMPNYKNGGMQKLAMDIRKETKSVLKNTQDRGEVIVGFTVNPGGRVTNSHIVKRTDSEMLNTSALTIVNKLNNWDPGKQRGKSVEVDLTVSIDYN